MLSMIETHSAHHHHTHKEEEEEETLYKAARLVIFSLSFFRRANQRPFSVFVLVLV